MDGGFHDDDVDDDFDDDEAVGGVERCSLPSSLGCNGSLHDDDDDGRRLRLVFVPGPQQHHRR